MSIMKEFRRCVLISSLLISPLLVATPPQTPVEIRFAEGVERLGKRRVQVELEAIRRHEQGNATITVWVADYIEGRRGERREIFRTTDPVNETKRFRINVPVPRRGVYVLTARAEGGEPGNGFSHVTSAYLRVSENTRELVPPERFKDEENRAQTVTQRKEGVAESGWPLQVNVSVTYVGPDGAIHPLSQARVDIYEDDIAEDDFLGSWILHDDGKASGTVTIPTDLLGKDEIYLEIFTANDKRFFMGTLKAGTTTLRAYKFTTPSQAVTQGTMENISYRITSQREAMTVWSILNAVWTYTSTTVGYAPSMVLVWYPGTEASDEAYFSESQNLIAIGEEYYQGPMVIDHEFGHAVQYQLNNEWLPEAGGEHSFCPGMAIDTKLAWVEGYANAFALASSHSPDGVFHWTTGDTGRNLEHYSCAYHDMPTDEGRVAAAIWDLVDAPDDCNEGTENKGRNGFCDANAAQIVAVKPAFNDAVRGQRDEDAMSWWWKLHDNYLTAAQNALAENVMKYNWTPYSDPKITSFSWKCVDTPERCKSQSFDGVASWTAEADKCTLYSRRNNDPWAYSAEGVNGQWGFKVGPTVTITMRLECEGFGVTEQTIVAPNNSQ